MNENQIKVIGMSFLVNTEEPCNIYSIEETLFSSLVIEVKETGKNLYVVIDERPFEGDYFLIPDDKFGVILHKCTGIKEQDTKNSYYNGFILNENNLMYTPKTCYRVVASSSISDKLPVTNYDMISDWVDIYRLSKIFGLNMAKFKNQPFVSVDIVFKDQTLTDILSMDFILQKK